MKNVWGIVEGIGLLILVFLILDKSNGFDRVVGSIGKVGIPAIKALQGR